MGPLVSPFLRLQENLQTTGMQQMTCQMKILAKPFIEMPQWENVDGFLSIRPFIGWGQESNRDLAGLSEMAFQLLLVRAK
jgi:hypothetical protein